MKLLWVLFFCLPAMSHQLVMKKIETLNETEPYAPLIFHQKMLWVGRADVSTRKSRHRIEVRSSDGEKVLSSKEVSHSVERLYSFDDQHILITGKAFTQQGWRTYYSLARFSEKEIFLQTHALPETFQVEEFAGGPGVLFFNETGDRSIVQQTSTSTELLPLEISGPGKLIHHLNTLWVLERKSFYLGDENLVMVDLNGLKTKRVFKEPLAGLTHIFMLHDKSAIASTEYNAERIHLVDTTNPSRQASVVIPGTHPRALAQWGSCLIVASENPLRVSIVQLKQNTPSIIHEQNLEPYAEELPRLSTVTVDPESAAVFLRSASVAEIGSTTQNSIYRYTSSYWIPECSDKMR